MNSNYCLSCGGCPKTCTGTAFQVHPEEHMVQAAQHQDGCCHLDPGPVVASPAQDFPARRRGQGTAVSP